MTVAVPSDSRSKAFSGPLLPGSHFQPWVRNDAPLVSLQEALLHLSDFVTSLRSLSWLLSCCCCSVAPAFSPPRHSSHLAGNATTPTSLGTSQGLVGGLVCGSCWTNVCFVLCHCFKIEACSLIVFYLYILWYLIFLSFMIEGLPWWVSDKESACQCRRLRFDPWVGNIPWRRKWQPTPVFMPGEFRQRSLTGCSPQGCKRVRHDLATDHARTLW